MIERDILDVAESIADDVIKVTHDDLVKELHEEINQGEDGLLSAIKEKMIDFIAAVEDFDKTHPKYTATIGQELQVLEAKKNIIYARFFEIQNLINRFVHQRIVMTYVHVDDNGTREIRITDNDIEHLGIGEGFWGTSPYHKLTYDVNEKYRILDNKLSALDNQALQETAAEVERRYNTYKKRVLWYYPSVWKGYTFSKRGPINEAFVNLYIHQVKLTGSMEGNIDTFMLDEMYGAKNADATKGFLIGDVSRDEIQYAVKGSFASPQGFKDIVKEFKKIIDADFSMTSFYSFLDKYTRQEAEKEYKSQIKEMSARSLSAFLRYHEEELMKVVQK